MVPGSRLIILGKQGAGKGTQCVRLARHYVVPHIATGDMFRAAKKSGSDFGKKAAEYMESGELVPDEIVLGMVAERLEQDDIKNRGFLLDGFPRTVNQAVQLFEMLAPLELHVAIDLEVATEVVLRRLASRRVCQDCQANYSLETPPKVNWTCDVCGGEVVQRPDDTEAAIHRRLRLYERETEPLVTWFLGRDKLTTVDGVGTLDQVFQRCVHAIDLRRERARR